jgi:hypothetical protein
MPKTLMQSGRFIKHFSCGFLQRLIQMMAGKGLDADDAHMLQIKAATLRAVIHRGAEWQLVQLGVVYFPGQLIGPAVFIVETRRDLLLVNVNNVGQDNPSSLNLKWYQSAMIWADAAFRPTYTRYGNDNFFEKMRWNTAESEVNWDEADWKKRMSEEGWSAARSWA